MKPAVIVGLPVIAVAGLLATAAGSAEQNLLRANLIGFREVPAVSTMARGQFTAEIIDEKMIAYELTYSGLEGTVTQGHIHFGQRSVNGGVSLWLCQTDTNKDPTNGAPTCPQEAIGDGTVKGTLMVENLVGPAGQGIDPAAEDPAGEFAEILKAMRAGVTYANVHSSKFGGGEIRGQIRVAKENDRKRDHDLIELPRFDFPRVFGEPSK